MSEPIDDTARIERALQDAQRRERDELNSDLERQRQVDDGIADALSTRPAVSD